jgi:hypothetical protein
MLRERQQRVAAGVGALDRADRRGGLEALGRERVPHKPLHAWPLAPQQVMGLVAGLVEGGGEVVGGVRVAPQRPQPGTDRARTGRRQAGVGGAAQRLLDDLERPRGLPRLGQQRREHARRPGPLQHRRRRGQGERALGRGHSLRRMPARRRDARARDLEVVCAPALGAAGGPLELRLRLVHKAGPQQRPGPVEREERTEVAEHAASLRRLVGAAGRRQRLGVLAALLQHARGQPVGVGGELHGVGFVEGGRRARRPLQRAVEIAAREVHEGAPERGHQRGEHVAPVHPLPQELGVLEPAQPGERRGRQEAGVRDAQALRPGLDPGSADLGGLLQPAQLEERVRKQEASEPFAFARALGDVAVERLPQRLERARVAAAGPLDRARELEHLGAAPLAGREAVEPADHGLRRRAHRRKPRLARAGHRVDGALPLAGVEPVVDRGGEEPGGRERLGRAGPQLAAALLRALVLEPRQQELPEQRVEAEPAALVVHRPQEETEPLGAAEKVGRQAEGRDDRGVELGRHARVDQCVAELGLEAVKYLLGHEVERGEARGRAEGERAGPAEGGERDAEGPAAGGLHDRLDLGVIGMAAAPGVEDLRAFGGAHRQISRPELGHAAGGPQLREPQRQLAAARHSHAEGLGPPAHQLSDRGAGRPRVGDQLGVLEHDRDGLEQQPAEVVAQRPRGLDRVLQGQPGGVRLGRAGRDPCQLGDQPAE